MKQFINLLNEQYKLPSNERQVWASSETEKLLSEGPLHAWHLGDPVPMVGQRILIGTVCWSGYDLRLLDALSHAFSSKLYGGESIDVFDVDVAGRDSGNWDFLEQVIPDIGKIYQTLIVGIWKNRTLVQSGSGAAGRDLIIDRYGLNRAEILVKS